MPSAKRKRVHPSAVLAPMPATLDPMLPTLVRQPFSDPEYLFEPKLDGYRAICFVEDSRVRFLSRKGHRLTERFPELRQISASVKAESAIIDGEVVALDQAGLPCFEGLHGRSSKVVCVTVFYAFDLLYLDGYDLTQCPLIARKTALRKILPKSDTGIGCVIQSMFSAAASVSSERLKECGSRAWWRSVRTVSTVVGDRVSGRRLRRPTAEAKCKYDAPRRDRPKRSAALNPAEPPPTTTTS
jgi:ATP-dependent DNA ligase